MTDPRSPPEQERPRPCANTTGASTDLPSSAKTRKDVSMHVEPTGSYPPVQPSASKRCPACDQARPLAEFPTSPAGHPAACCSACRRAAARLASRRRAAAVRLLVALHPQEWAGLLALVSGRGQPPATRPREVA